MAHTGEFSSVVSGLVRYFVCVCGGVLSQKPTMSLSVHSVSAVIDIRANEAALLSVVSRSTDHGPPHVSGDRP